MKLPAALLLVIALARAQDLPAGKGRDILNTKCNDCHSATRVITAAPKSKDDWQSTVERMMDKGIEIRPADEQIVVAYLARYFGEEVHVNAASAKDLQEQLGLSAAEADAIVEARIAAPLKSFDDLGRVPGLDAAKLEPLKNRLVF